jgi:hypothetical protein
MQVIEEGLVNTQISTDFAQYLPLVQKFLLEAEKGRTKCDFIKIAYLMCINVCSGSKSESKLQNNP